MTGIAGVSVSWGNLLIQAPKTSGNVAQVSIDSHNHFVKVTLNGQTEEFNPSVVPIYNLTYIGGSGGGDTFTDDTNLVSLDFGSGGNNTFTGSSSYNFVFFTGNGNTFNAQAGSVNDVFEDYGTDQINNPGNAIVQVFDAGASKVNSG
jgi:hypothetical protein